MEAMWGKKDLGIHAIQSLKRYSSISERLSKQDLSLIGSFAARQCEKQYWSQNLKFSPLQTSTLSTTVQHWDIQIYLSLPSIYLSLFKTLAFSIHWQYVYHVLKKTRFTHYSYSYPTTRDMSICRRLVVILFFTLSDYRAVQIYGRISSRILHYWAGWKSAKKHTSTSERPCGFNERLWY